MSTLPPPGYPGLTTAQVKERIARGDSNNFRAHVGRSYWEIVRDNLLNLFNIVLFALLLVVLLFQDYATVFFAGFSVVTNSFLGMFQEIAARRKLDQLAALQVKEARVWRDGSLQTVPITGLVVDDVIAIEPGVRLVVDGQIIQADSLEIDESQLTGESDAVLKEPGSPVSSGSFCIAGTGLMVATQVGRNSTINKLSKLAKAYKHVLTPTQQKISAFVQLAVIVMAVCTPMVFIAGFINDLPSLEVFRNAVVFVSSLVPQGLVLTAILSLTIGAISISRHQTLIQRVNAVESLANVTVLCFDKTGTLTRNQLAVTHVLPINGTPPALIEDRLRLYVANLAYMNKTAAAVADYCGFSSNGVHAGAAKLREIPFNSARKWGALVFPDETLIMGAPERVLSGAGETEVARQAQHLAAQGYRVLALARSSEPPGEHQLDEQRETLALIILSDQVRDDIQETLAMFREQNVALKVISGDNLETVREIAAQSGMTITSAYTGEQLEHMAHAEFEAAVADASVFARIEPDTKRKIIASLKRQGHYVAMVGDGVNDVPALKEANLAIVMNDGAQISKDVGDIVLLNNAMSTLPLAFREGREITQTIYGTSKIFLVKNIYSTLFFIFVGFMAMPFPISPIQISWLTFGVINIPATLIAFKLIRPAFMRRFRDDVLDYVITGGLIGAAMMSLLYSVTYLSTRDGDAARSAITVFMTLFGMLVFWNVHGIEIFRPGTIRQHLNIFLLGLILAMLTILAPYLLPYALPRIADTFRWVPPSTETWTLTLAVFLLTVVIMSVVARTRGLVRPLWHLFAP